MLANRLREFVRSADDLARPLLFSANQRLASRQGIGNQSATYTIEANALGCRARSTAFRRVIMLVLTRKRSEMIQIGENVMIKVIQTGRSIVKIGIEAPDSVRVIRAELAGIPGPGHPLAAFLQERRKLKRVSIGNSPGLSSMLGGPAAGGEGSGGG
jgi:carbon storage regulator